MKKTIATLFVFVFLLQFVPVDVLAENISPNSTIQEFLDTMETDVKLQDKIRNGKILKIGNKISEPTDDEEIFEEEEDEQINQEQISLTSDFDSDEYVKRFEKNKEIVESNNNVVNVFSKNHEYYSILGNLKEDIDTENESIHSLYIDNHVVVVNFISDIDPYNLSPSFSNTANEIIINRLKGENIEQPLFYTVNFGADQRFGVTNNSEFFLDNEINLQSLNVSDIPNTPFCNMFSFSRKNVDQENSLSGKRIVLIPAHGLYQSSQDSWADSRGAKPYGISESEITIDLVSDLKDYLVNAGAEVYVSRDLDKGSGNGESGEAKWKEGTSAYLKSIGAPVSVYDAGSTGFYSDINARPYFANCLNPDIYISIHTNAGEGSGTMTFYKTNQIIAFSGKEYQDQLAQKLNENLITHFRGTFDRKKIVLKSDVLSLFEEGDTSWHSFFDDVSEPLSLVFKANLSENDFESQSEEFKNLWIRNGFIYDIATSGGTNNTLVDTNRDFSSRYKKPENGGYEAGKYVRILDGSCANQEREIIHRPSLNVLDIQPDWDSCTPDNTSEYLIPYTWQNQGTVNSNSNPPSNELVFNQVPMSLMEVAFHSHSQGDPDSLVLKNEYLRKELMKGVYDGIVQYFSSVGPDLQITQNNLIKTHTNNTKYKYQATLQIQNTGDLATKEKSGRICFYPKIGENFDETTCYGHKTIGQIEPNATKDFDFSFETDTEYEKGKFVIERVLSREKNQDNNYAFVSDITIPATSLALQHSNTSLFPQSTHRFGVTKVNEAKEQTFTIANGGQETLTINSITLVNNDSAQFEISGTTPTSVAAHSSVGLTVKFKPNSSGLKETTLQIQSNDQTNSVYEITLNGLGDNFIDVVENYWSTKYIEDAESKKIIQGYNDGTFKSTDNASRAEVLKMAYNATNTAINEHPDSLVFTDLNEEDWFYQLVIDAKERGFVKGKTRWQPKREHMEALFGETEKSKLANFFLDASAETLTFKDNLTIADFNQIDDHNRRNLTFAMWNYNLFEPNSQITRAEAVKVIAEVFNFAQQTFPEVSEETSFSDVNSSDWFYNYVNQMANAELASGEHIIAGYDNGTFGPNDNVTREQMAKILINTVQFFEENFYSIYFPQEMSLLENSSNEVEILSHLGHLYEQVYDFTNSTAPAEMHLPTTDSPTISETETLDLNFETHDADGDEMFYFWNATGGSFTAIDNTKFSHISWTPPNVETTTTFVITATRGDGRGLIGEGRFEITVEAEGGSGSGNIVLVPTIHGKASGGNWNSYSTWVENDGLDCTVDECVKPGLNDIVEIKGTVTLDINAEVEGIVVGTGSILQNSYSSSRTLKINGDIVNNGTLRSYNYYLTLKVGGDIENHGTWNPYETTLLSDVEVKNTTTLYGRLITGSFALLVNSPNVLTYASDTLGSVTTTFKGAGHVKLTKNVYGIIGGTIPELEIVGGGEIHGTINFAKVAFTGTGTRTLSSDLTINGDVSVGSGSVLQNSYSSHRTLKINGDIVNNGTLQSYNYYLTLKVGGDIENHGTWNPYETILTWSAVSGATAYDFQITDDNNVWKNPEVLTTPSKTIANSYLNPSKGYRWRTRALVNGVYTDWSTTKLINRYQTTGSVTSGGSLINLTNNNASVEFPINATNQDLNVQITELDDTGNLPETGSNYALASTAYEFTAQDLEGVSVTIFAENVTITLKYNPDDLGEILPSSLKINYYDEANQVWMPLNSVVDTTNHTVTAQVNHFTKFAILGDVIPKLALNIQDADGDPISGAQFTLDNGTTWQNFPAVIDRPNLTQSYKIKWKDYSFLQSLRAESEKAYQVDLVKKTITSEPNAVSIANFVLDIADVKLQVVDQNYTAIPGSAVSITSIMSMQPGGTQYQLVHGIEKLFRYAWRGEYYQAEFIFEKGKINRWENGVLQKLDSPDGTTQVQFVLPKLTVSVHTINSSGAELTDGEVAIHSLGQNELHPSGFTFSMANGGRTIFYGTWKKDKTSTPYLQVEKGKLYQIDTLTKQLTTTNIGGETARVEFVYDVIPVIVKNVDQTGNPIGGTVNINSEDGVYRPSGYIYQVANGGQATFRGYWGSTILGNSGFYPLTIQKGKTYRINTSNDRDIQIIDSPDEKTYVEMIFPVISVTCRTIDQYGLAKDGGQFKFNSVWYNTGYTFTTSNGTSVFFNSRFDNTGNSVYKSISVSAGKTYRVDTVTSAVTTTNSPDGKTYVDFMYPTVRVKVSAWKSDGTEITDATYKVGTWTNWTGLSKTLALKKDVSSLFYNRWNGMTLSQTFIPQEGQIYSIRPNGLTSLSAGSGITLTEVRFIYQ